MAVIYVRPNPDDPLTPVNPTKPVDPATIPVGSGNSMDLINELFKDRTFGPKEGVKYHQRDKAILDKYLGIEEKPVTASLMTIGLAGLLLFVIFKPRKRKHGNS